jgi:PTS system nitrogen regulatory IIA component
LSLAALTRPELIFLDLPAGSREEVLRVFAERLAASGLVRDGEQLFQRLWEREQLGSTGIGNGVAIPHCKLPGLREGVVAVGRVPEGVDFQAVDGRPVKVFFLVISPSEAPGEHLKILAAISRWIRADEHAGALLEAADRESLFHLLAAESA